MTLGAVSNAFGQLTPYTPIGTPQYSNEATHEQIFEHLYSGNFTAAGVNFSNGTISAVRVADRSIQVSFRNEPALSAVLDGNLDNNDQLWQANFSSATARAVFGSFEQEFGYYDGASGGTYHKLFDANGWGYGITGSASLSNTALSNQIIRWARGGETDQNVPRFFSSREDENPFNSGHFGDHMVTYQITGLNNGVHTWLLMWEDKLDGEPVDDFDYNDLVVRIEAIPLSEVPEPATVGIISLAGVMALSARRRR